MFLVDTSVWIDYLREKNNTAVKCFSTLLDEEAPFGITSTIYQELLQGAASKSDFNNLIDFLGTQRFYHPHDNVLSYQNAAELYFNCRRKGITIRSTIDCLIAQIAIENNLILLHNDQDFHHISVVSPDLKLFEKQG